MKQGRVKILVAVSVIGLVSGVFAETKFLAEVTGGYWHSIDLDGFAVTQGGATEVLSGNGSAVDNLKLGVELYDEHSVVDFSLLGGFYGNGAYMGYQLGSDGSIRYKFRERQGAFTLGLHAGVNYYFAPSWDGLLENAVDFDGTIGGVFGIKSTYGWEKVRIVMTLDMVGASFKVTDKLGTSNRKYLDMDGFVWQVGVQF